MTLAVKSGVDVSLIPSVDVRNLSRDLLAAVERFFDDPQHQADFERWKATRREVRRMATQAQGRCFTREERRQRRRAYILRFVLALGAIGVVALALSI